MLSSKLSSGLGQSRLASSRRVVTLAHGGNGGNGKGFNRGYGGDSGSGDNNNGNGPSRPSWLGLATLLSAGQLIVSGAAHAGKKAPPPPPEPEPEPIEAMADQLWNLVGPILTNLGFSGVLGVVAAIAFKVIGKAVAVLVGLVFAGVQVASYYGYINVNWTKVHSDVSKMVDQNGDGKLDKEDFKIVIGNVAGVLAQGLPSVGGFCAGFMLGLKMA